VLNEVTHQGACARGAREGREEGFVVMAAKASTRVDPFKPISQLIDCRTWTRSTATSICSVPGRCWAGWCQSRSFVIFDRNWYNRAGVEYV
jgi:hypothetical protein